MNDPVYLECACHSEEHTLKFVCDPESQELFAMVFLHQYRGFWKKLWMAIRYVFGYKSKFGHWDCFILRPEDAPRLRVLLDQLEQPPPDHGA